MEVRLLVANQNASARQVRLGAETIIGRSPACNLRIASGKVSRRHCRITVAEGEVRVQDLGSSNGTLLNGTPVSTECEVTVPPGSTLDVGPLKFIVAYQPPRRRDDRSLLDSSSSSDSANRSVLDSDNEDDTKDYVPPKKRRRSEGEKASPAEAGPAGQTPEHAATPGEMPPEDTVFDAQLADHARDLAEKAKASAFESESPVDDGTNFDFEEEDVAALSGDENELPGEPPIIAEIVSDDPASGVAATTEAATPEAPRKGWGLWKLFGRQKAAPAQEKNAERKPSSAVKKPPAVSPAPPDIAPVELSTIQPAQKPAVDPTGAKPSTKPRPPVSADDEDAELNDFLKNL